MMKESGLPGFEGKDIKVQKKEMQRLMRRVFSTPEGKTALNVLLTDLHYFDVTKSEGEAALRNYAAYLITERLGIVDTIAVTDAMLGTDMEG